MRELREADGAGRSALARRAGISPTTLRRVECNRGPVMVKRAPKIPAAGPQAPALVARDARNGAGSFGAPALFLPVAGNQFTCPPASKF